MERRPFVVALADLLAEYRPQSHLRRRWVRALLPHPGTILFIAVVVGALLWAESVGAVPNLLPATAPASATGTIAYQGRLADPDGTPLTGTYPMIFRLYGAAGGGTPLWEETWTGPNGVAVSDGLFNVMLGSLVSVPGSVVTGNGSLWLGITVGTDDEMAPRVQLGSVPWAVQALTVPDGSITTAKLADSAVSAAKRTVTTFSAYDPSEVLVRSMTQQDLLRFEASDVPPGDIMLVADLHGLAVTGSSTSGTLYLNVNGASVDSAPTHWLPPTMTQKTLHGRLSGFPGGELVVTVTVAPSGSSPDMQFGYGGDNRFGRRLTVVSGL